MLNVTALLGRPSGSDDLRYGHPGARSAPSAAQRRPVVVWNCTRRCNLACLHCYSDSDPHRHPEMTTEEGIAFLDDIARFGVPAVLFSGGEPLVRRDIFTLIAAARERDLPVTLSSNGTLITEERAERLAELGVRYAGISLDGIGAIHDHFRGRKGAFERTLRGIRNLRAAGVRTGLRVTLSPTAIASLTDLFTLIEQEGIARVCFYHLVPAGRGVAQTAVSPLMARAAVERIFAQAHAWAAEERGVEVLTVDNYADGPALRLWAAEHAPDRVEAIERSLTWNGGAANAAGRAVVAVDWEGRVRPDQFWPGEPVGNVREQPLSELWRNPSPMLAALRRRSEELEERCSHCRWLSMCGGGLASRSLQATGRLTGPDPACYLGKREIESAVVAA
ncbi:MAG TPA: radical SAM protein [Miltoncostaeaceae bacterium]|nr:radical SAM protein [Miltoncostaeaceae bacterium]